MDTNVRRVEPNPAVAHGVRPVGQRRKKGSGDAFEEELAGSEDGEEERAGSPPGDRSVAPPAEDEAGGRIDVVG